jgi:hypothetical protein
MLPRVFAELYFIHVLDEGLPGGITKLFDDVGRSTGPCFMGMKGRSDVPNPMVENFITSFSVLRALVGVWGKCRYHCRYSVDTRRKSKWAIADFNVFRTGLLTFPKSSCFERSDVSRFHHSHMEDVRL